MGNTYQDKITEIQSNNSFLKNKLEGGKKFKLISDFKPAGDQPQAIKQLIKKAKNNQKNQKYRLSRST